MTSNEERARQVDRFIQDIFGDRPGQMIEEVDADESVIAVRVTARNLLDEIVITKLSQAFAKLADGSLNVKYLVVDLSGVSHLSSSALGMLFSLHKKLQNKGGSLALTNIPGTIREVMIITHIDTIIPIFDSTQAAMRHFTAMA